VAFVVVGKIFFGNNCEQKCIDSSCSVSCFCNDSYYNCSGEDSNCTNDITINNQSLSFTSTILFIQGNISIDGSNVNLTSINLITDTFLSILNSNIFFNSSSIISNGCINLKNTKLTIDYSNTTSSELLVLFNSSLGCLNVNNITISIVNQPKCTTFQRITDSSTLSILFQKQTNCEEQKSTIASWEIVLIIVGSIIGVAIIFIVLALAVPPIRKKNIPFRKRKKEDNTHYIVRLRK